MFFRKRKLKRAFRNLDNLIDYDMLKQMQKNNAIVIDVRSKQEFSENHIQGAINVPSYDFNSTITNIVNDRNKNIVLYCKSGLRSMKCAKALKKLGYKNVFELQGGIDNI